MRSSAACRMAGLADATHAEWTKLRTVSSTSWLLLTSVGLTIGAGAITSSAEKCPASCGADPAKISLTGVMLGQTTIAVLAVLPTVLIVYPLLVLFPWLMRALGRRQREYVASEESVAAAVSTAAGTVRGP